MNPIIKFGLAALLLGASVAAFPATVSAQTGDSVFDHEIGIIKAKKDLERICAELDEAQAMQKQAWTKVESVDEKIGALTKEWKELGPRIAEAERQINQDVSTTPEYRGARLRMINLASRQMRDRLAQHRRDWDVKRRAFLTEYHEFRALTEERTIRKNKAKDTLLELEKDKPRQGTTAPPKPGDDPGGRLIGPEEKLRHLEAMVKNLEDEQFSITTELKGEAIFAIPESENGKLDETGRYMGGCIEEVFLTSSRIRRPTIEEIEASCKGFFDDPGGEGDDLDSDKGDIFRDLTRSGDSDSSPPIIKPDGTVDTGALERTINEAVKNLPPQQPGQAKSDGSEKSGGGSSTSGSPEAKPDDAPVRSAGSQSSSASDASNAPIRADAPTTPQ